MDFIPLPDNAIAHQEIPDLGGPEFDHQGFHGYDQRQGWNVTALRNGNIRAACTNWLPWANSVYRAARTPGPPASINKVVGTVAAAFVQTWILLGILQEALRRPVFRHEISRTVTSVDSEGETVSTYHITVRRVFAEFLNKGHELEADPAWADRLYHSLREAAEILRDLELLHEPFASTIGPVHVHLALSALVRALDQHRMIFCRKQMDSTDLMGISPTNCRRFESILRNSQGWCPSMLRRVFETLELQGLYFASLMPGFGAGQVHNNCRFDVCIASNIDHGDYKVEHAPLLCQCKREGCDHMVSTCACPHVEVEGSELATALAGTGFPLVKFQKNTIEVSRFEPGTPYVAISHMQAIQKYVRDLTGAENILFWMDTLCVPLQEPLRNTAIIRMAEVYRSATHVLVLAKDMLGVNLPSTPTEALCRIFCSQWASRLWTMQEAALAKELVFQFADNVVAHDTLSRSMTDTYLSMNEQTHYFGVKADQSLRQFRNIQQGTSSKEGNVPIRKDAEILVMPTNSPEQYYMAAGPRLRIDGLRWAPSNLLDPETAALPPDPVAETATPTGAGLLTAGIDAVILQNVPLPDDEATVLRFELPGTGQQYFCFKFISESPEKWPEIRHLWNGICVLLLAPFHHSRSRTVGALVLPTGPLADYPPCGEGEVKTIPARYLARVNIIAELEPSEDGRVRTNDGCDALRNAIRLQMVEVLDVADSKSVDVRCQWCIA
ncbi:hypothetical protein AYL99_05416 [Fonsecaea erecta]|uniref:Heterokaryon incompatibility domain-containing protein n=1 Tax=Fonsecaea erecta TaxID=1367422 RepID=A0A178ZKU0_9EURO|nr:hypothetical protein AYL99_05416 [Fonsecaea erecta]OAP60414.1 hypothetical protein AYL99_05416 [Fonsecaea erecta]